MSTLFEQIRNHVPFREVVLPELPPGSDIVSCGAGTERIVPCPFCQSKKGCTLYSESNSFHCFACRKSGDLVKFIQYLHGFKTNAEAARYIAERSSALNVPGKTRPAPSARTGTGGVETSSVRKAPPLGDAAAPTAEDVRAWAADFYHRQLLENGDALSYQTDQRRHSLEILKRFKIGYSTDHAGIVAAAGEHGISPEALTAVGLLRESNGRRYSVAGRRRYVYPHFDADGRVLTFTFKDPTGDTHFQMKRDHCPREWLCYNQAALNEPRIVLVEGENDLLSVVGKGRFCACAAIVGNRTRAFLPAHIRKIARGRLFYLCFDNDEAGRTYTRVYGEAVCVGGGRAKAINLPAGRSGKDIDLCLRESDDPEGAFQALLDNATDIECDAEPSPVDFDLDGFTGFTVIGEDAQERLVIYSNVNQKCYAVKLRDLTYEKLVQIGGEQVSRRIYRRDSVPQGVNMISFKEFRNKIILSASKKQLSKCTWIGQGIHYEDE